MIGFLISNFIHRFLRFRFPFYSADYTSATDWTNGLVGAPSSTSYMNTFSPLQASPPSYVAYDSCPMVDHPNYSLTASGGTTILSFLYPYHSRTASTSPKCNSYQSF